MILIGLSVSCESKSRERYSDTAAAGVQSSNIGAEISTNIFILFLFFGGGGGSYNTIAIVQWAPEPYSHR